MKLSKMNKNTLALLLIPLIVIAACFVCERSNKTQKEHHEATIRGEESSHKSKTTNDSLILLAEFEFTLLDPTPGELYNAKFAILELTGTIIEPGEIFSQNEKLGPYTQGRGYEKGPMFFGTQIRDVEGGGVCKVATLIYNIANLANLEIIERHNHSMPVDYVPLGQDATVAYGYKDIRFRNNTDGNLLILAKSTDKVFTIAIYGETLPPEITWEHVELQRTPFQTIYRNEYSVETGKEVLLNKGMDGCLVESRLIMKFDDGHIEERPVGRSYYNPMPEVILKGVGG
jgi:vancomycin resistance protein VanW